MVGGRGIKCDVRRFDRLEPKPQIFRNESNSQMLSNGMLVMEVGDGVIYVRIRYATVRMNEFSISLEVFVAGRGQFTHRQTESSASERGRSSCHDVIILRVIYNNNNLFQDLN